MNMNEVIAKYEENNFVINIDADRLVAKCDRPAPKARYNKFKNEYHYRFESVERMNEYVENWIDRVVANKKRREEEKVAQKLRAAERAKNVKVGDIFVDSWGYEQTNVDFFQVVAKPSARTVIVREIACRTEEGSEMSHGMADNVFPVRDAFIGEEMKKRIDNYGGFKTRSFSCARPTDENRSHYRSWYA